jgi:hypothetical protein
MLVPPPPKSSSTATPLGVSPGSVFSAVSDATASDTKRGAPPSTANAALAASELRSVSTVRWAQCAGTAIAMSADDGPPLAATMAASALASSRSAG